MGDEYWARTRPPASPTSFEQLGRSLYAEISDETFAAGAVDDEHRRLLRDAGLIAAIIVPSRAQGRIFWALTLVSAESKHRDTDAEFALE